MILAGTSYRTIRIHPDCRSGVLALFTVGDVYASPCKQSAYTSLQRRSRALVIRKKEDRLEAADHSRSKTRNQRWIDFLRSTSVGRPFGRDFQRQNSRNPFLCQRMSVSGLTTMRAFFQSNSLARVAIVSRVALSVRRGACLRSTKNVSCFRRKRFSAARALRERHRFRANATAARTIDRILANGPTSKSLHVLKTPVAKSGRPARSSRAWQV